MVIVDVNVLIAAFDADHDFHGRASPWLKGRLEDPDDHVIIPDIVWVGFVRIVTNAQGFPRPATMDQVTRFVRAVIASPGYGSLHPRPDRILHFLDVTKAAGCTSRHTTDAYLASLALRLGCPIASYDRDFRRFDGLALVVPEP
ncbi:MAG: PIN domain-containing protein [Micrococcales bacterium]|nr:PIN domain-containing protein [Micrococcales bacterium]